MRATWNHSLLFSGHIQEMDLPAYKALLRLAAGEAQRNGDPTRGSATKFFARHGLLTAEHLANPRGVERQVALIKHVHLARLANAEKRKVAPETPFPAAAHDAGAELADRT